MVKALITLRGFGDIGLGYHGVEFARQSVGIPHLSFGVTGVDTYTFYIYFGARSIEVLVFQVAQVASIHGVCPVATKLFDIEMMGTHADFLVGIEAHANVSVLYFIVVTQVTHGLHDLSNARFVVCSQQCCAVGDNQILADMRFQFREFLGCREDARREFYVISVVVANDSGLYILATCVRTGVIMRDKANRWRLFLGVGFKGCVDISHVVHLDIAEPLVFKFFLQILGKVKLFCR